MIQSQTTYASDNGDAAPLLKPGWSSFNILLMVLGFVFFWPLGIAMLAYNIWGHKWGDFKRDIKRQFANQPSWCAHSTTSARTGNAAFDAYRAREFARLEEERAKIDAMKQEFEEHLEALRQARDQEEFDRFIASRNTARTKKTKDKS